MPEERQSRPTAIDLDLVEYLIVAVPESSQLEGVARALVDLVEFSAIRVLDLVVIIRRAGDTRISTLEIEDVEGFTSLRATDGEIYRLLSDHDIEMAALSLGQDMAGVLLLVEDSWAEPLAVAAREAGGRLLAGERIPRTRLVTTALADVAKAGSSPAYPGSGDEGHPSRSQ
jgi:Family of unknown function (DUF6325)